MHNSCSCLSNLASSPSSFWSDAARATALLWLVVVASPVHTCLHLPQRVAAIVLLGQHRPRLLGPACSLVQPPAHLLFFWVNADPGCWPRVLPLPPARPRPIHWFLRAPGRQPPYVSCKSTTIYPGRETPNPVSRVAALPAIARLSPASQLTALSLVWLPYSSLWMRCLL